MALLRILLYCLFVFVVLFMFFFMMVKFLFGPSSTFKQREQDISKLKDRVDKIYDGLVPINLGELKLLSGKIVEQVEKNRHGIWIDGVLQSIYQEPLFAISIKEYKHSGYRLLYGRSTNLELKFFEYEDYVEVFQNGALKAKVQRDGKMLVKGVSGGYQWKLSEDNKYYILKHDDEQLVHVVDPKQNAYSESDRLISMFHDFKVEDIDELLIMLLYKKYFE